MKVSIVTAVLNSHEIVRRQIRHYSKTIITDDVEVIFVDDGSVPPILYDRPTEFNFSIYKTDDFRAWTQPAARNFGAKQAKGEYLICTDIDHIITRKVIEVARNAKADVIRFKREAAVLDENGDFTQDMEVLREYGFDRDKLRIAPHGNSYIFRRELYLKLGGVDETYVGTGKYPNREEVPLKRKLKKLWKKGEITIIDDHTKPMIYMIPNGRYCNNGDKDYNPFGLFHNLTRSIRESRRSQRAYAESA
jgi:glycosyltransferase involved in cell wall biosynthesis